MLFDASSPKLLAKLQIVQNRCLKLVHGITRLTPTNELHSKAKVHLLSTRRSKHVLQFAFVRSRSVKSRDVRSLNLRSFAAPLLKVPGYKSAMPRRALEFSGAMAWNSLSTDMRLIDNDHLFKLRVNSLPLI